MKKNRLIALLAAFSMISGPAVGVYATPEEEMAAAQYEKQAAEAGLSQTYAEINSLENQKWALESYLGQLEAQLNEVSAGIAELDQQAAVKAEELKVVKKELKQAKKTAKKQYNAMKLRIAYMYENGGSTMLEMLLTANSFADFLNKVENVSQISKYDREMLKKYEETRNLVKEKQNQVKEESAQIDLLKEQKIALQRDILAMVANTRDSIYSYAVQISANESEASALISQIAAADNNIYQLMEEIERENVVPEEPEDNGDEGIVGDDYEEDDYIEEPDNSDDEVIVEPDDDTSWEDEILEEDTTTDDDWMNEELIPEDDTSWEDDTEMMPDYDPDTDTMDSSSSSTSSDIIVEEEAPTVESSSGSGTYLGNFTLTAYCNCSSCCGSYAGGATASGAMPVAGRTVAMSGVPFGTQLLINGNVYTVEDLGTPYGHVDIYHNSHEEALSFGRQYADVYQLN